ncbi:fatty acyl-AMP ligase [Streptomyces europaeiscabiei]|uniref:fatty acyl-AMP ligase n=1 Tax=Streptomyces europaeiscabiei TaxID=146819 RepID=UPI002E117CEC|nr:fatty acyl-AMP ligase [Streptomyces europaeiscabiei]
MALAGTLLPPQATRVTTVTEALHRRGVEQPDEIAYVHLRDGETPDGSLTYGRLETDAHTRAAALGAAGLAAGDSALLLYPSGLEFVRTLLGCMYARVAAAPVQVPTRRRGVERLRRIADDAGTTTILTTGALKADLERQFADLPELAGITLIDTEALPASPAAWYGPAPLPDDIALLQYTSGSTGDPKGVMVTHANFLANVTETEDIWPTGPDGVVVSWLPLFHDMGMLFGILLPLCSGVPAYLMEPAAFIRRPLRWLEAISAYRGTHAAAPSFAYELCVDALRAAEDTELDLSSWRVAANGAEPVRWRAVRAFTETFAPYGFAPRAMTPGYGLAENTLKATASPADRPPTVLWVSSAALKDGRVEVAGETSPGAQPLVGSGFPSSTTRVRVVDPATATPCEPGRIGEIWIDGPCVALGYRERPRETEETFGGRIAGESGATRHLRTGDLGFLHAGELFVAGRVKDVIIRNGRNFYPQDIELSAESAVAGLRPNCAAAFSVDDGERERLVVVVETDGRVLRRTGAEALREAVRAAVHDGQRLPADEVVVVRRGALPRTTSGKVQRRACRKLYAAGELGGVTG